MTVRPNVSGHCSPIRQFHEQQAPRIAEVHALLQRLGMSEEGAR
jgi:hypothetical protein